MGIWSSLFGGSNSPTQQSRPDQPFFDAQGVPNLLHERLEQAKAGTLPWISTLTAPELALARSHGVRMIAPLAATCWMHYGFSWTEGHKQGWNTAQQRLQAEAAALGANAVIDVKMISLDLALESSMDYSLVGTAVRIAGLPPSPAPILSTVPALEFVQLLEAGIVPVGLAVGARFAWSKDNLDFRTDQSWRNGAMKQTTSFWESIRRDAHHDLRADTARQGRGVLAQLNFSQIFRCDYENPTRYNYLGRHIVMGTVVDGEPAGTIHHPVEWVLDLSDRPDLIRTTSVHHNSLKDGI
ncbi:heavy metal-binding domain-containing protein [Paraburkholderia sp. ZP32-5]|uniref:heavy metal-binding domain-containing protein n=1 Tax=Paraburkholderia sp. ZP32-5 TaxID=2883245 RepID=UPI001F1E3A21|nr:heavy metal-binding domain-containing protein [Paraburkholderia sp. ZP32-5]